MGSLRPRAMPKPAGNHRPKPHSSINIKAQGFSRKHPFEVGWKVSEKSCV
jgi:hypothetical protein